MKLVTYLQNGIEQIGVLTPAEDAVVPAGMLGLDFADMAELAVQMTDAQRDTAAALLPEKAGEGIPLEQVKLLAPPVFSAMWRTDWIPIPLPVRLDDWKISFFFRILPSKVFSTWIRSR